MRLAISLALLALTLFAAPDLHAQQNATIADFAGPWVGRTEAESDRDRAATVLIESGAEGAFTITWTSFEADPPGSGDVVKRQRSLTLTPSKVPGLWTAPAGADPFRSMGAWAEIQAGSLIVNTAALRKDGRLERQAYTRSLTQDGMSLSYKRWLNQDLDREIEAEFLKITVPGAKKP